MAYYGLSYPGNKDHFLWGSVQDARSDQYTHVINGLRTGKPIRNIDIIKHDKLSVDKVGGVFLFGGEVVYHDYYNGNVYRVSESGRITKIGTEDMFY